MSQKYPAKLAFKELQLTTMPASALLDCKNDHSLLKNTSSIQTESGNRRECIQKLEKALLTWVYEMHAQAVNVSWEMTKETGVRIVDGVNEMLPMKRKFI